MALDHTEKRRTDKSARFATDGWTVGIFPCNHRFVLGERIEQNLHDVLEKLIRAKYARQHQELQ